MSHDPRYCSACGSKILKENPTFPCECQTCGRMINRVCGALDIPGDAELVAELRNTPMMVNYGNGDVRDEPDPLHEAAADRIETLSRIVSGAA